MAERPKRPMSAYMLWMNSVGRRNLKDANPEFKMTQVSRKCGELWRNMTEEEKSIWQAKAAVAMSNYKAQVETWKSESGQVRINKYKLRQSVRRGRGRAHSVK